MLHQLTTCIIGRDICLKRGALMISNYTLSPVPSDLEGIIPQFIRNGPIRKAIRALNYHWLFVYIVFIVHQLQTAPAILLYIYIHNAA